MSKKVTIHDISKALGIDSSTVSRALNDSPRVKQKTKDMILAKAGEFGYQRNNLASNLRTRKSQTIGVVVPRISRHFFSSAIAGIEEVAFEHGYSVMICQSLDNLEREQKLIRSLLANRVDGILVSISMETQTSEHFSKYKNQGYPLIFFDRPFDLGTNTNVIIDDFKASFDATEYLIKSGCKNIVHFSGPQTIELYQKRLQGYLSALNKYNLNASSDYILESRLMQADGIENAKKILNLPLVDAVFSANDTAAIAAMRHLIEQGVRIPEDLSFIGFSNEPTSEVMVPSLTTIDQPDFQIGKEAARLLINYIENTPSPSQVQTKVFTANLIVRQSTNNKFVL